MVSIVIANSANLVTKIAEFGDQNRRFYFHESYFRQCSVLFSLRKLSVAVSVVIQQGKDSSFFLKRHAGSLAFSRKKDFDGIAQ
jgi:hypothetical protein